MRKNPGEGAIAYVNLTPCGCSKPGLPLNLSFCSRSKINFTLDSDEESASDHEWETATSKIKNAKVAPKKRFVKSSASADDENLGIKKERVLPKRGATKTPKVWSFLNEDEDD